jgi:hypothetical protein
MQHLEVSGAVRPLKWPLGVKWLTNRKKLTKQAYGQDFVSLPKQTKIAGIHQN